ncbi:MAG TPA: histidine kinase [Actinomycetota bacterium]|nr:histidine kinase [Actinomycetota bacterium]
MSASSGLVEQASTVPEGAVRPGLHRGLVVLLAPLSVALAAWGAALANRAGGLATGVLETAVVAAWALAGTAASLRRPGERLGDLVLRGCLIGGAAVLAAGALRSGGHAHPLGELAGNTAHFVLPVALGLLPAAGLNVVLALPDGRCRVSRAVVATGWITGLALGVVLWALRPSLPLWPILVEGMLAAAVGIGVSNKRYRVSRGIERQRLQWFGWAVTVGVEVILVALAARLLAGWPHDNAAIAAAATLPLPAALAFGSFPRVMGRVDWLLARTVSLAGLTCVVIAVYLVIVIGLGHMPTSTERPLLGLSMLAAGVAALLYVPARERLSRFSNRLVYGEKESPDIALRTFGSRMTRAVPLDELLLQVAELLRRSMGLKVAEVWTGSEGRLERVVSVPNSPPATITLSPKEEGVVARAGCSGPAWVKVWLPALLAGREDSPIRVAPASHSGRLLGLVVAVRNPMDDGFRTEEELAMGELARQVGGALHNVALDSALQASLDQVRKQAEELRASRSRIVAASDAARRQIERNLHDGAQQHLVALAVNLGLAQRLVDADPGETKTMLVQLSADLKEAIQQLRDLAHGIYPPLLVDRGLGEALAAAGGRSALPTTVDAKGIGRHSPEVEAAVYFCCLEALQNAGKHAGAGATATITVREEAGGLLFEVADTGAGFDMASRSRLGAGFVNMADRVGAIGGSLTVDSAPGKGTRIGGRIPLA